MSVRAAAAVSSFHNRQSLSAAGTHSGVLGMHTDGVRPYPATFALGTLGGVYEDLKSRNGGSVHRTIKRLRVCDQ